MTVAFFNRLVDHSKAKAISVEAQTIDQVHLRVRTPTQKSILMCPAQNLQINTLGCTL